MMKQISFGALEAFGRLEADSILAKIDRLIDWSAFVPLLKGLYKQEIKDRGCERYYDPLMMFKAILLRTMAESF